MSTPKNYKRRQILLLLFAIVWAGIGVYRFSNIWITKSDLMQIKGTLGSVRTNKVIGLYKNHRYNDETLSQNFELIFHLNEYNQEYCLTENDVGADHIGDKYQTIQEALRAADTVSVWIKKNEQRVWRPQVFQLNNDDSTLLTFEHLHIGNDLVTAFLIITGIFLIVICSAALLQDEFKSNRSLK